MGVQLGFMGVQLGGKGHLGRFTGLRLRLRLPRSGPARGPGSLPSSFPQVT
jgi:hypothetical protein